MTTTDFITELYCRIADEMRNEHKHSQAALWPSETVTLGLLHALKGVGNRAFYRWLTRDYGELFPHLPECTRLFRLLKTHRTWTFQFLAKPTLLGIVDSFGIELIHPIREGRSPQQIGRKGPSSFLSSIDLLNDNEISPYLRLHLFEGVPFFLRDQPLVYEVAREWLSNELQVDPRSIIVVGSSSIGFSMAPPPDFGKAYSDNSDIDLTIISEALFEKLEATFLQWKDDYERGSVIPSQKEKMYWEANALGVPKNLQKGFIDTYKIPNRYKYEASRFVNDRLYRFSEKTKLTLGRKIDIKSSAQVYKNWKCFYRQFKINFNHAITKLDQRHHSLLADSSQ